ncbi:hypothetical protein DFH27DRAFT_529273 [Peziza echinospora]|nr:hypothetical protein DFH27DRAFT_529273 [Peziza echinospora]
MFVWPGHHIHWPLQRWTRLLLDVPLSGATHSIRTLITSIGHDGEGREKSGLVWAYRAHGKSANKLKRRRYAPQKRHTYEVTITKYFNNLRHDLPLTSWFQLHWMPRKPTHDFMFSGFTTFDGLDLQGLAYACEGGSGPLAENRYHVAESIFGPWLHGWECQRCMRNMARPGALPVKGVGSASRHGMEARALIHNHHPEELITALQFDEPESLDLQNSNANGRCHYALPPSSPLSPSASPSSSPTACFLKASDIPRSRGSHTGGIPPRYSLPRKGRLGRTHNTIVHLYTPPRQPITTPSTSKSLAVETYTCPLVVLALPKLATAPLPIIHPSAGSALARPPLLLEIDPARIPVLAARQHKIPAQERLGDEAEGGLVRGRGHVAADGQRRRRRQQRGVRVAAAVCGCGRPVQQVVERAQRPYFYMHPEDKPGNKTPRDPYNKHIYFHKAASYPRARESIHMRALLVRQHAPHRCGAREVGKRGHGARLDMHVMRTRSLRREVEGLGLSSDVAVTVVVGGVDAGMKCKACELAGRPTDRTCPRYT